MPVEQEQWDALWRGICELSDYFPEGVVFIGGVAVYLHVRGAKVPEKWVEFSHDGDFYISLADFSDLRDIEEVTQNRRLSKYQIIKHGMEFDVYLEYRHSLRIPYANVHAASKIVENVRIAALEHLLLLKLAAYEDRRGSAKGRKDERDLIRIGHLLMRRPIHKDWVAPYVNPVDINLLSKVVHSAEVAGLSTNPKHTAALRAELTKLISVLRPMVSS